jgi:hypothetical protein
MRRALLTALAHAILIASAHSADVPSLAFHPEILQIKYCLEKNGQISLHVPYRLEFRNNGKVPIVLLKVAPRLGFTLRPAEKGLGEFVRSEKHPARQIMDYSRMPPLAPDPELFVTLQPGETYDEWEDELSITLSQGSGNLRLGADYELGVEVNPWPDKRRTGESLRKSWAASGFLWVDPIESSQVKLHLEDKPRIQNCPIEPMM